MLAGSLLLLWGLSVRFYRLPSVLSAFAGVGGGLFLTLLSGLYIVKPLIIDAEMIYFGFPLAWFEAGRGGLLYFGPWVYSFFWQNFVVDFIIYGVLVSGVVCLYFARMRRAT